MENFSDKLKAHSEHVANMSIFCTTEETTKQALIMPFLDILGFTSYDPRKVKAEYYADFPGAKVNERVDYALFCHDVPVMFIEAKSVNEKVDDHCPQLSRYFNSTPEVTISAITNGREWRFYTDLKQKNIMDPTPFLKIRMDAITASDIAQLFRFRYDKFKPEALRTLAEESVYLTSFTKTISSSLRDVDMEFVRYVASRSNIERQLNQRFLESVTPLVKQAVERAVSAMVVSGLSTQPESNPQEKTLSIADNEPGTDIVDAENPNIITTTREIELFERVTQILQADEHIVYKDTESYFGVLLDGKTTRWIVRYYDKKISFVIFPVELNEIHLNEIRRARLETDGKRVYITQPEDILRVSGLVLDAFDFVKDDDNFKRGNRAVGELTP